MKEIKLTKKQKIFADNYIENGNGKDAALKAYNIKSKNKERVATSIASENLTKLDVRAYLKDKSTDAVLNIYKLANKAKNEVVRLNANKDILDRGGYKPIEKTDITVKSVSLIELFNSKE